MKVYEGTRAGAYGTAIIVRHTGGAYPLPYVDAHELERRVYGSQVPAGDTLGTRTFEWGYQGAGPRDTAASILADHYGQPQPLPVIQRFKRDVVARLGGPDRTQPWALPASTIRAWAVRNQAQVAQAWAGIRQDVQTGAWGAGPAPGVDLDPPTGGGGGVR